MKRTAKMYLAVLILHLVSVNVTVAAGDDEDSWAAPSIWQVHGCPRSVQSSSSKTGRR